MDLSSMTPSAIVTLSVLSSQSKVTEKAGTMMLAKTLDQTEQSGAAMVDMMKKSMELSVNPNLGSRFDALV